MLAQGQHSEMSLQQAIAFFHPSNWEEIRSHLRLVSSLTPSERGEIQGKLVKIFEKPNATERDRAIEIFELLNNKGAPNETATEFLLKIKKIKEDYEKSVSGRFVNTRNTLFLERTNQLVMVAPLLFYATFKRQHVFSSFSLYSGTAWMFSTGALLGGYNFFINDNRFNDFQRWAGAALLACYAVGLPVIFGVSGIKIYLISFMLSAAGLLAWQQPDLTHKKGWEPDTPVMRKIIEDSVRIIKHPTPFWVKYGKSVMGGIITFLTSAGLTGSLNSSILVAGFSTLFFFSYFKINWSEYGFVRNLKDEFSSLKTLINETKQEAVKVLPPIFSNFLLASKKKEPIQLEERPPFYKRIASVEGGLIIWDLLLIVKSLTWSGDFPSFLGLGFKLLSFFARPIIIDSYINKPEVKDELQQLAMLEKEENLAEPLTAEDKHKRMQWQRTKELEDLAQSSITYMKLLNL